ncbi:MAG: hypothetical protein ACLFUB_13105 [Cyclobacteriaceae bacterium]
MRKRDKNTEPKSTSSVEEKIRKHRIREAAFFIVFLIVVLLLIELI